MKKSKPLLTLKIIIREKDIQLLQVKGMVEGMSRCALYFDFYEHCLYGKLNRVNFPSGSMRERKIMELIHSDGFGLVPILSLGGSV
jgi:hypothetical protein